MTFSPNTSRSPLHLALALGVLGGAALIVMTQLTTNGPLQAYVPYTALVLGSLVAVRLAGWREFSRRFQAAFGAFMLATVLMALFVTIVLEQNFLQIPLWHWSAVLSVMGAIGAALSAAVAYLAGLGRQPV